VEVDRPLGRLRLEIGRGVTDRKSHSSSSFGATLTVAVTPPQRRRLDVKRL
jgi:hypothetical protein